MPLLGFTVPGHREKILSGEKDQTIRKLRKIPIKVGDHLYLYWHLRQRDCEKLGETNCIECPYITVVFEESYLDSGKPIWRVDRHDTPSIFSGLTLLDHAVLDLARHDGFPDSLSMMRILARVHPHDLNGNTIFQVIRWGRLEKKEA